MSLDSELKDFRRVELEGERMKIKRHALGNVKFIGELFKKKMLKETIMHACIGKLLCISFPGGRLERHPTQRPDDEDVEALCKLLVTVGQPLDSSHTKVYMEHYFAQLKLLAADKETSSRTRFMIQDLEDQRRNRWVPRRKQETAKTLDQIRKEAARDFAAPPQKGGRGGGGGGGGRGGGGGGRGGGGGHNAPQQRGHGGRGGQQQQQQQQPQKFGRAQSFEGGGQQRNNGAARKQQQMLQRPPPQQQQQQQQQQQFQQNQNQQQRAPQVQVLARPLEGAPISRAATLPLPSAAPPAPPAPPSLSDADVARKAKFVVDEYVANADAGEALACLAEEIPAGSRVLFAAKLIDRTVNGEADLAAATAVLSALCAPGPAALTRAELHGGLASVWEFFDDVIVDAPKAPGDLAALLAPHIASGLVSLKWLDDQAAAFKAADFPGCVSAGKLFEKLDPAAALGNLQAEGGDVASFEERHGLALRVVPEE